MRSRKRARMMHPPRQMVAMSPSFRSHLNCSEATTSARILARRRRFSRRRARRGWRRSRPFRACASEPPDGELFLSSSRRIPRLAERTRAKTASVIPVSGTPSSSAFCVVQRPGSLLLRLIDDDVDQRLARRRVGLAQNSGDDLDQITVEVAFFPLSQYLPSCGRRKRCDYRQQPISRRSKHRVCPIARPRRLWLSVK